MDKIRLALLFGGVSSEREVSLNSGKQVWEALDKNRYEITHYDPKTDLPQLVLDAKKIDAALIILHGPFGEDGTVQGLLDLLDIPYQGAGVLGSSVAMNKLLSKRLYEDAGIPTPAYCAYTLGDTVDIQALVDQLGLPVVVKPVCAGSSVGMGIIREQADIRAAIDEAFTHDDTVIVEEFIDGMDLTCGVLGNRELEALPPIEIIPGDEFEFFDYTAKYTPGASQEICPARIPEETTQEIYRLAVKAHKALFLKGYSRTDFRLSKGGDLTVFETNTIPGMTATSLYPQSAEAAGYTFSHLLDKLIELAMDDHKHLKLRRT